MRLLSRIGPLAAVALLLGLASSAFASSAGFEIRAEGGELSKPDEEKDPPRYHVKLKQGQTLTLVAQGVAYPRGGRPSPTEPEAGAWLFDDEVLKLQAQDRKKADKTAIPIRLLAGKVGTTRVRFVGIVLGYERRYDIIVEVVAAK